MLDWKLTPPTYSDWLSLYLRNAALEYPDVFRMVDYINEPQDVKAEMPKCDLKFDLDFFRKAICLLDVFTHMEASLHFPASIASAAAFYVICLTDKVFNQDGVVNGKMFDDSFDSFPLMSD